MGRVEDKLMLWGAVKRARHISGDATALPQVSEIQFLLGSEGGGSAASETNVSNVFVEFCEIDALLKKQGDFVYGLFLAEYAFGVTDVSSEDHVYLQKNWTADRWKPGDADGDIVAAAKKLNVKPEWIVQWRVSSVKSKLMKKYPEKVVANDDSHGHYTMSTAQTVD